ncbi:MAG: hypothetical protein ACAI43_12140 [Phycisphaerae bacterium]|nr:hypothetical protein [Tepidisphaeraceae bacterium]
MLNNPIMELPLTEVIKPEIALTLQHVLRLYTVGNLLEAWRTPKSQRSIEQVFETPQQARHAVATCATWLGRDEGAVHRAVVGWWADDRGGVIGA